MECPACRHENPAQAKFPEEARKILDPVLTHMMDAVHRYEGHGEPGDGRRDHGPSSQAVNQMPL